MIRPFVRQPFADLTKRMTPGTLTVCAIATLGVACADTSREAPPAVTYLSGAAHDALDLPFSEAVRVGNTIYLSGQIGIAPGATELVPGGIVAETKQTLENVRDVLERHGSGLDRVVKCTVFLADIGEWPTFNEVYVTYFDEPRPARSAVAGSGLALGARVEVDCIAVADGG